MPTPFQSVVTQYRANQNLTVREFSLALSENPTATVSPSAVSAWENGEYPPTAGKLLPIMLAYKDWRRDFALDLLAIIHPNVYKPVTKIGRTALVGVTSPE